MVRARREIRENAKIVDIVIEIVDARAPLSTANPDLPHLIGKKPIIRVLGKADLAEEKATRDFVSYFRGKGLEAIAVDVLRGHGTSEVVRAIEAAWAPLADALLKKRQRVRPARVMIVGLPNVGKSSLLNRLAGRKAARTGATPGITRGRQWIRVKEGIELLDTPGIMWPKIENEEQGMKLALLAVVGERAYEEETVAGYLIALLQHRIPEALQTHYRVEKTQGTAVELIEEIGKKRGFVVKGGSVDLTKTARAVIEDFRKGVLGRVTLDEVPEV